MTVTLNHRQDWSLGKEQTVSMGTLGGGIRCRYEGWNRHLEWMVRAQGAWHHTGRCPALSGPCIQGMVAAGVRRKGFGPEPASPITTVKGLDMNRWNIEVEFNTQGKCRFYPGGHRRNLAKRAASRRSALQAKGTCGATRDGRHGGAEGYPLSNQAETVGEGFRQTPQGEHLGFCGGASQDGLQNPAAVRSAGLGGCGFLKPETAGLRACWTGESAQ
jgi:hypothetical protein